MELHFQYFERVQGANRTMEDDGEDEDEIYLRKLEAGLFTLQLIDYIIIEIASSTSNIPSIRQRVLQILNLRNSSIDTIKSIVRGKICVDDSRLASLILVLSFRIRRESGHGEEKQRCGSYSEHGRKQQRQSRWFIQTTLIGYHWEILRLVVFPFFSLRCICVSTDDVNIAFRLRWRYLRSISLVKPMNNRNVICAAFVLQIDGRNVLMRKRKNSMQWRLFVDSSFSSSTCVISWICHLSSSLTQSPKKNNNWYQCTNQLSPRSIVRLLMIKLIV